MENKHYFVVDLSGNFTFFATPEEAVEHAAGLVDTSTTDELQKGGMIFAAELIGIQEADPESGTAQFRVIQNDKTIGK